MMIAMIARSSRLQISSCTMRAPFQRWMLAVVLALTRASPQDNAWWFIDRDACSSFLYAHPAVTRATADLLRAAAVPPGPTIEPVASALLGRQNRWSSFEAPSYLPATVVEIRDHIGRTLTNAFDDDPATDAFAHGLPSTLQRAIEWTSAHRFNDVPSMRESISSVLIEIATRTEITSVATEAFARFSSATVRRHCELRVGGVPNPALVAACTAAFCLTDKHLCAELVVGMLADYTESTGNWRPKLRMPTCELTPTYCHQQNVELVARLEKSGEGKHDRASYDKTCEEVAVGTMEGPFEWSDLMTRFDGYFLLLNRFGVWQNGVVRPCDDGTANGFNDGVTMHESLRCIAADWPARVAKAFALLLPDDGLWDLLLATDDVARAFRQVSCAQPQFTAVALRNPNTGTVEFYTLGGFNFGLATAPNQFNRVTHFLSVTSQHLFGAACGYYYDDIPSVDPSFAAGLPEDRGDSKFSDEARHRYPHHFHLFGTMRGSSQWCIGLLATLVGFPFAQKKRVTSSRLAKFLGVMTDFRQFIALGSVRMFISEEKRRSLVTIIEAALLLSVFSGSAASRLAGKLSFVTMWSPWRFGRAMLQPLFAHAKSAGARAMHIAVRSALEFFLSTLPLIPDHVIHVFTRGHASKLPRVYLWSDAAWSPDNLLRPAGLGIVLLMPAFYDSEGTYVPLKWYYAEANCPIDFLERFCLPRTVRIGELELLAAVCAYLTFPHLLKDRKVTHWIDNTGALASLIKGYARAADLAKIVHAFAVTNLALSCLIWFEYVRSKANIADLPSRGDFELLRSMNAVCVELVIPPPEWWDKPRTWYDAACIARDRHASGAPTRSRAAPTVAQGSDLRPRRRKRPRAARLDGEARPPLSAIVALAGAADETKLLLHCTPGATVDVDITRSGPFGNPYTLGILDLNTSRRREAVVLHERWILARSMPAGDMRLTDGSPIGVVVSPRSPYWKSRTGLDLNYDFERLMSDNPEAEAFRFVCSRSCRGNLCHGTALIREFRLFLDNSHV